MLRGGVRHLRSRYAATRPSRHCARGLIDYYFATTPHTHRWYSRLARLRLLANPSGPLVRCAAQGGRDPV